MWIARDNDNSLHLFVENKPILQTMGTVSFWVNPYNNNDRTNLDTTLFPEINCENGPQEVALTII